MVWNPALSEAYPVSRMSRPFFFFFFFRGLAWGNGMLDDKLFTVRLREVVALLGRDGFLWL